MPMNITSAISRSSTTAVPMIFSGPRMCMAATSPEDWPGSLKSALGAVGGRMPGDDGDAGASALPARGHHARRGLAVEIREDRLRGLAEEDAVALRGDEAEVRREDHVVEREQRMAFRQRLDVEHVEGGARDAACAQRLDEGALVDDGPARRVDEEGARLHEGEVAGGDESARLVG